MGEMFVLRKWFLSKKKKSCKCLKPCQRRKGSAGRRCGCSRCNPGLAGSPSVPLRFQPAPRAPDKGPVFGEDQAVLRRLTLGGRTVPFLQQPVPTFASYELSTGGFRPSHRTTLCS